MSSVGGEASFVEEVVVVVVVVVVVFSIGWWCFAACTAASVVSLLEGLYVGVRIVAFLSARHVWFSAFGHRVRTAACSVCICAVLLFHFFISHSRSVACV